MKGFDVDKAFLDDADTGLMKDRESEPTPERKAYDALISLIDRAEVERCQEQMISRIWRYTENFLDIVYTYKKRKAKASKSLYHLMTSNMNRVENRTYPVFSPLLVKYDFDADFERDADINDSLEATIPKVNSLTAEIDENDYKLEGIYRGVTFIPFMEEGDKDLIDEEIVSRVDKIEILNPYEICFAFFHSA